MFAMEDASNTVQILVACAMQGKWFSSKLTVLTRRNKRNGQPDEGVCDICHAVRSDELLC